MAFSMKLLTETNKFATRRPTLCLLKADEMRVSKTSHIRGTVVVGGSENDETSLTMRVDQIFFKGALSSLFIIYGGALIHRRWATLAKRFHVLCDKNCMLRWRPAAAAG